MLQEIALSSQRADPLATPQAQSAAHPRVALVTGAAGFIGSHLAERLLNENFIVLGLDSFSDYYARELKENNLRALRQAARFTFVEADLCKTDLRALLTAHDVRYIFHQAGQAGVRPSWGKDFVPYVERNILATQALLEQVCTLPDQAQIEKFVFASSSSVYGDAEKLPTDEDVLPRPISPYGVTKLAAEHLCSLYAKQYGLPVVALRYFSVYGPRQRPDMAMNIFIDALLRGKTIRVFGDGEQTREMTFVGDIVEANLLALNTPNGTPDNRARVYNIGGGARSTLNAILEMLGEIAGAQPRLEYLPRAAGDHRHGAADIARAQRDLGYAPRVALEEGLRAQYAWQRSVISNQ
ncbi:MAG: NAD-dependent epimerase/dehydratase family protein [Chloroflexi bacterium]|nr:NAD-dependent epimerase/dehydratase family protein [Chloroflexota bacterium]